MDRYNPFEIKRRCADIAEYCRRMATRPTMNRFDVCDLRRMTSSILCGADMPPVSRRESLADVVRLAEQIGAMDLTKVKRVQELVSRLAAAASQAARPFEDFRS